MKRVEWASLTLSLCNVMKAYEIWNFHSDTSPIETDTDVCVFLLCLQAAAMHEVKKSKMCKDGKMAKSSWALLRSQWRDSGTDQCCSILAPSLSFGLCCRSATSASWSCYVKASSSGESMGTRLGGTKWIGQDFKSDSFFFLFSFSRQVLGRERTSRSMMKNTRASLKVIGLVFSCRLLSPRSADEEDPNKPKFFP